MQPTSGVARTSGVSRRKRTRHSSSTPYQIKVNGKYLCPPDEFDGPIHNRSCTDIIFLILFVAFCVVGIFYLVYAGVRGDPDRLIHGYDDYGNVCGKDNYQYFPNINSSGLDQTSRPFCQVTIDSNANQERRCNETCPTKEWMRIMYYCFPSETLETVATKGSSVADELLGKDFFESVGRDINASWREILYMSLIALVLALVVTAMLRFLAGLIVWITVAIIALGSVAATIYLWVTWHLTKQDLVTNKQIMNSYQIEQLEGRIQNFLIYAIITTIVTVLVLILLIAMRKRIKLVIALFKEAGKAVASMPFILLQPVWTCLSLIIVLLVWCSGWLLIESSGEPQLVNDKVEFVKDSFIRNMRWYHIFGLLWFTEFVIACQHLTIAGSIAQWYFTRDKGNLSWPILTSFKRLVRYHLGSVALGSLIIAIVKFIRLLLKRVEKWLTGRCGQGCSWALKICQCCLWCFEKFLKFLNRNAYIEIAIYGYSFCKGARQAFTLLINNAFRVAAINSVGAFVLFLAKAAVVISTVFIGIEIMKSRPEVTHMWVPILLSAIIAYLLAHCFISVYEMAIDTLFLCFCEDCERNDGIQRPYYMSKGLMQFVENSKKALEALEGQNYKVHPQPQKVQQVWATNVHQPNPNQGHMLGGDLKPPSHPLGYQYGGATPHGGMTPVHAHYPPTEMPPPGAAFMPPAVS